MGRQHIITGAVALLCLLGTVESSARTDYFSSGFYTRGAEEATYMNQGGIPDPFYIPGRNFAAIPRATLEATRDDNFFMTGDEGKPVTTIRFVPGVLLIYGRPEHNHLYTDLGVGIPLYRSFSGAEDRPSYMATAGGVYRTGLSRIHGRVGYRRIETQDLIIDRRLTEETYVADLDVEHRISTKSSIGALGSLEVHEYSEADFIDYRRLYGAARYYHRMTKKSEWFIQPGIGRDLLVDQLPGVYGDATFYDFSVGVRGKLSPKTAVFGRVGYRWREYDDSSISGVNGWVASLGAEAAPFGLSRFYSELSADIRPDVTGRGDSVVDKRITLGVNRRLFTERLRGDASVMAGITDRNGPQGNAESEYWGYRLGLDWWTRWNMSLGVGYSYREKLRNPEYESGLWHARVSWNY